MMALFRACALAMLGLASVPALAQDIPQSRADIVVNFKNFQNALAEYIQERDQLEARLKWVLDNWVPKPEPPIAQSQSK